MLVAAHQPIFFFLPPAPCLVPLQFLVEVELPVNDNTGRVCVCVLHGLSHQKGDLVLYSQVVTTAALGTLKLTRIYIFFIEFK